MIRFLFSKKNGFLLLFYRKVCQPSRNKFGEKKRVGTGVVCESDEDCALSKSPISISSNETERQSAILGNTESINSDSEILFEDFVPAINASSSNLLNYSMFDTQEIIDQLVSIPLK